MKRDEYYVRVDEYGRWTPTAYRKVKADELDKLLEKYGEQVMSLCSRLGSEGAMVMWAYFKNLINNGCYSDMINAYRLLSDDSKSLVDREHEFRHLFDQYRELRQIRYHGSVEQYYLDRAKEARECFDKYMIGGADNG